jgi:hypothetical protein
VKHSSITYYLRYIICIGFYLVLGGYQPANAQGLIQAKIKSKVRATGHSAMGKVRTSGRMKVSSSKRALKSSLRGGKSGVGYNTDPSLDELIEDEDLKADLYDNTNKKRYVKLLGEWTTMPSDAALLARAKLQAFKDSINNIDRDYFRVTKNIPDGSRPMFIFGWHPHWMGEIYRGYDYGLFNVVSYYSYDINPSTGAAQNPDVMAGFLGSDFVATAQGRGCSALLSVTCHGEENVRYFLDKNMPAQQRFMDSILYILDSTNADGLEINFEGVTADVQDEFFKFVRILSTTVTGARGDTSFIFMSVPSYDPENIYDISKLQDFVDIFIVKGFDFHQTPTGLEKRPPAPLNYSKLVTSSDLSSSVDKYIANLGPLYKDRLVLALPYFGTRWVTDGITEEIEEMNAITYGDIQFDFVMQMDDQFNFPGANLTYDTIINTYKFSYFDYTGVDTLLGDVPYDVTIYFDDSISLARKYQYLQNAGLGGVGIQFLGSDGGFDHLEQLLSDQFTEIITPEEDVYADINEKSKATRENAIYVLAVLLYLAIFIAIGFCAALFNKQTRQVLFDNGRFRLFYMAFFTLLMLSLGGYMGLFKGATVPLLVGVSFGAVMSWIGWKMLSKKKSLTP